MGAVVFPRPDVDQDLVAQFVEMSDTMSLSCVVSDAMFRAGTMRTDIKPKGAPRTFVGTALTIQLSAGDIVDCLDAFTVAQAGDVIVIDAFGETETSIWGGLMTGLAKNAGVVGAVIDGSCRDTDEAKFLDFPVSAKASGPRQAHTALSGRREPLTINSQISCGASSSTPATSSWPTKLASRSFPSGRRPMSSSAPRGSQRTRQPCAKRSWLEPRSRNCSRNTAGSELIALPVST